jgi:hypothetical protein
VHLISSLVERGRLHAESSIGAADADAAMYRDALGFEGGDAMERIGLDEGHR